VDDPLSNDAMPTGPRCTNQVPEALCNGLRPSERPRCQRRHPNDHTKHGGKCRSSRSLPGVGSTEWKWKPNPEVPYKVSQAPPPGVILKREPIGSRLKRYGSNACRCAGLRHEEPCDFAGLLITKEK
jgi:hypothetical protein